MNRISFRREMEFHWYGKEQNRVRVMRLRSATEENMADNNHKLWTLVEVKINILIWFTIHIQ